MSKNNTYQPKVSNRKISLLVLLWAWCSSFQAYSQCPAPIVLAAGDAYELTADAGLTNYQWFRETGTGNGKVAIAGANNQKYEVTTFGKYSWTAQDHFACPNNSCCEVEFVVPTPCPEAKMICLGEAYRIAAPAGLPNYQWFRNIGNGPVAIIGATNQSYEVTEYGVYTLISTDASGCPTNACCPIEFKACCTVISNLIAAVTPNNIIQGGSATLTAQAQSGLTASTSFTWFEASAGNTSTFSSTIQNPNTGILNIMGGYTYTVTAQNIVGSAVCTATATTSLTVSSSCVQPNFNARIDPVTCIGDVANNDAKLLILQVSGGDKVGYSIGDTYTGNPYTNANVIVTPAGQLLATNLANPTANTQTYTVRVFNQNNTCYRDKTLDLNRTVCTCPVQVCLPFTITRIRN